MYRFLEEEIQKILVKHKENFLFCKYFHFKFKIFLKKKNQNL